MAAVSIGRTIHNSLTSPNLRTAAFEKIDTACLIKSYVEGQKTHAKSYAKEGQVVSGAWDRHTPAKSRHLPSQDYGFGTPILKPRMIEPSMTIEPTTDLHALSMPAHGDDAIKSRPCELLKCSPRKSQAKATCSEHLDMEDPKARHGTDKQKQQMAFASVKTKPKPPQKRHCSEDPGEERDALLAERRERKRAKRAIIKPKDLTESEDESERALSLVQPLDNRKGKAKRKKNSKVPTAFALMHGFSATNVGKNRLTLKPGPAIGVFNKGKASAKTRVVAKKKSVIKAPVLNAFSEFTFLNKTRQESPNDEPAPSRSSLPPEGSESTPSPRTTALKRRSRRQCGRTNRSKVHRNETGRSKPVRPTRRDSTPVYESGMARKAPPVESVVWDIELEDSPEAPVSAFSLSQSRRKTGTVVLETRAAAWAAPHDVAAADIPTDEMEANARPESLSPSMKIDPLEQIGPGAEIDTHCAASHSSSLAPSQSASQHRRTVGWKDPVAPSSSKYFFQAASERVDYFPAPEQVPPTHQHIAGEVSKCNVAQGELYGPTDEAILKNTDLPPYQAFHSLPPKAPTAYEPSNLDLSHEDDVEFLDAKKAFASSESSLDSFEIALQYYQSQSPGPVVKAESKLSAEEQGQDETRFATVAKSQTFALDYEISDASYAHQIYRIHESCYEEEFVDEYRFNDSEDRAQDDFEYLDENIRIHDFLDGSAPTGDEMIRCENEMAWEELECDDNRVLDEEFRHDTESGDYCDGYFPESGLRTPENFQYEERPRTSHSSVDEDLLSDSDTCQHFTEGRALLLGFMGTVLPPSESPKRTATISCAEADVVKRLKGHWLPQKL